jgi:MFS family permease
MAQEASLPAAPGFDPAVENESRLSTFHSLRYRDYRYLWQGQIGAAASNWMEQIARPLLIYSLTDSALMVGLLQATRLVPQLILGVWAGVLADRVDKRRMLLFSKSVALAGHLSTAILLLAGVIEPWMVFVTTFVTGSSMAFDQPARQSLIPWLVPDRALANAIALNSAAMNSMRVVGASIAGLILAFLDFGDLYLIQSLIYVYVIYCTVQIKTNTKVESTGERTSMLTELMDGFRAVGRDKVIFYILVLSLFLFVFGFPYQSVFIPLIAIEELEIGRSGVGLLVALTGVGAIIGSLTIATIGDTMKRRGLMMLVMVVLYAGGLLLFASANSLVLAVPALLLTGCMQTSFISLNSAYVLGRTPVEMQGRIMSLFSLDRGLIPLGATLAGALASVIGPSNGLVVMASFCLGFTLLLALLAPSFRRIS